MEEWFSRFFQDLQLQLGLRDPKLTAPEKNISGIFLETDTGENIDILLVGKDGCAEELRGRTPAEELVRFTSLDFAEYHAVIQRLWTEHPLFLERMDVPYSDYGDFEKQIGDLPDWIMKIDTISAFYAAEHLQDAMAMQDNGSPIFPSEKGAAVLRALDEPCRAQLRIRNLLEIGFADYERAAQWKRYGALEEAYPALVHQFFPCRPMPFGHRLRYTVENNFELYLLELQLYFRQKKKRIARCECCWQYFIPKTSAETHYCDRVIDGLSCKALGPKLKGKDGAALDEALRIYNVLRHRMEERRNRYEDAPPDQRDRLKPVSDARYQEWISAAVKVRGRYLKGKISASDFLREIDSFGELETYKVEQVSLPEPDSTAWRRHIKGNLDFDPAINYRGFMHLDLREENAEWKVWTPEEQENIARELCDEYGVLLIFDEVATGFGRTGNRFVADLVLPDILVLGKALTGGYIGHAVTVANEKVFRGFYSDNDRHALMHGPTFMGNALACAVALKGIEIFERENYMEKIKKIEEISKREMLGFSDERIKEVRVMGGCTCVEVYDPKTLEGFQQYAYERGVFSRPFLSYMYSMVPYVIEEDELVQIFTVMKDWFRRG